jgi:signal transduction histidine kinase
MTSGTAAGRLDWLPTWLPGWLPAGAVPVLDPAAGGTGPATYAMQRVATRFAAVLRASVAVLGSIAALVGLAPPGSLRWVLPAVLVNCGWAAVFVRVTLTRGLTRWLVLTDVGLTALLGVAQVRLTAHDALPPGAGWIEVLATISIVVANLAFRVPGGVAAGLVVVAGYLIGAQRAGLADHGLTEAAVLLIQVGLAAALIVLIRRGAAKADRALAQYERARQDAELASTRRAHEREHNRRLHDTVLATLTIVGTGAISRSSDTLARRARSDLSVIEGLRRTAEATGPLRRLDQLLDEVVGQAPSVLRVDLSTVDCLVAAAVAEAFASAAAQALSNVARHAGVAQVWLRLAELGGKVTVTVSDDGCGFDPAAVPAHRYGLREAIRGRMFAVGGTADIVSAPGAGTTITLTWRRGDG